MRNDQLNMHAKTIRILMLGDVVGAPGLALFQKYAPKLKRELGISMIVVNGENSGANGKGITPKLVHAFKHAGADIITTGNHIWQQKDIYPYLSEHTDVLRPENFPRECPGRGVAVFTTDTGIAIGVLNLQGRVFMREHVDCPFKAASSALTYLQHKAKIILVDMHAETTAEKLGLAYYLEGKVSAIVGTHTHVQTADERILPGGTAYITDLGMGGALNSMIGMKKEGIIRNFLTQMPVKHEVDIQGPFVLSGVWIDIDTLTGKAVHIERVRIIDTELQFDESQ